MLRVILLLAAAMLFVATAQSHASLLISIGNLDLKPASIGTVNVTVSSSDGSPIDLDAFGFHFAITRASGQGRLEFDPTQNDPFSRANYVFFQNSGDDTPRGQNPLGMVSTTNSPNNTYIGSDFTNDSSNVIVTTSKLLASLTFTDATSLPPTLNSTFQISLIQDINTFFLHDSSTTPVADPFQVVGGLVTFLSPFGSGTAVPEPSSLMMILLGGLPVGIATACKGYRQVWAVG